MVEEIEKWWNDVSDAYQKDMGESEEPESAHYGPFAPTEEELNLLGKKKDKKILEIGCGAGRCSIAFAKKGAECKGIDISKEQLKHARRLAEKNNVKVDFEKGNIQTLDGIDSQSYDVVYSAFALQYVPDLAKCFKEVHRVLKGDGIFVFGYNHPFYHLIDPETLKIKESYFDTGRKEEVQTWGDGTKHKFVTYRRKVSDIYNALVEAGFFVEKMLEPIKMEGPPFEDLDVYKEELAEKIGPTIIFKARKRN